MPGKKNTFQRRTQYIIQARSDRGRMSHYHGLCRLLRGIAEITRYPGSRRLLKPYEVIPMRTVQRVTATILLILFILHGILGATSMTGISNIGLYPMLVAFLLFLGLHILCGLYYVIRSLKGPGKRYFKLNRKLWLRRISGLLLLVLALCHAYLFRFLTGLDFQIQLALYTAVNILLLLVTYIHIRYNVDAYIIAHGAQHYHRRVVDLLVFLSVFFAYFTFANLYFYFS